MGFFSMLRGGVILRALGLPATPEMRARKEAERARRADRATAKAKAKRARKGKRPGWVL